jgi:putative PIN family toxin of toxin-antitoxin system
MRVVLDTNTVISAVFWGGFPGRIVELAKTNAISICTSRPLLDELMDVLSRKKFLARFNLIASTPSKVLADYAALAEVVSVPNVPSVVADDPDDDEVIACAVTAKANYIISGDRHLLKIGNYDDIFIVNANQFIDIFNA